MKWHKVRPQRCFMFWRNEHATEVQHEGNIWTSKELENGEQSRMKKILWKIKAKQTTWCLQETALWMLSLSSYLRLHVPEGSAPPEHSWTWKWKLSQDTLADLSCSWILVKAGKRMWFKQMEYWSGSKVWSLQQYHGSKFWYHFAQWEWLQLIQCVRALPGISSWQFWLERSHLADVHTSCCTHFRVTQLDETVPNECAVTLFSP